MAQFTSAATAAAALLLALLLASASGHRQMHGRDAGETPPGKPSDTPGRKFDFKPDGGARAFLDKLEPAKLQRILANSKSEQTLELLAKTLDEDDDFGVDLEAEALIYQCNGLAVDESLASALSSTTSPSESDPAASNAFMLTSRPGAPWKIWLDFRGGTVTGTAWNRGGKSITVPPYDKDSRPSEFSLEELSDIVAVWRAVAEDFAPFNVDVTTTPPSTPQETYTRVMIGGKGDGTGVRGAGGVAYLNSFGNAWLQPCYVFSVNLGNNPKNIWEATSHEVGHTLGLNHDGVTGGAAYFSGQGDWAPIMGVGYYMPLSQWSKGEYASANNLEDDLATMAAWLDYASTTNGAAFSTATPLVPTVSGSSASANALGIIRRTNVADFFSFVAGSAGSATISASVTSPWGSSNRANIDLQLTVYDGTGAVLATLNPAGVGISNGLGVASSAVALRAAGTHYMAVSGAGAGSSYSSYGSLGQYALALTYPAPTGNEPPTTPPPDITTPPPPPADTAMVVSGIAINAFRSGANVFCRVVVSVRSWPRSGLPVSGALVGFRWESIGGSPLGWPYTGTATTATNGDVTISSNTLPRSGISGCRFTVTGVSSPTSPPPYTYDATNSVTTASRGW